MAEIRGVYIPTTEIWNTSEIEQARIENAALKQLLVNMYMKLNRMATSIEAREFGAYPLDETMNGQKWYPNPNLNSTSTTNAAQRQAFRKIVIMPGLKAIAPYLTQANHGITITPNTFFTRIWGMAKDPATNQFIPIPLVDPNSVTGGIGIIVSGNTVDITYGTDRSNFTQVIAILEYIQS